MNDGWDFLSLCLQFITAISLLVGIAVPVMELTGHKVADISRQHVPLITGGLLIAAFLFGAAAYFVSHRETSTQNHKQEATTSIGSVNNYATENSSIIAPIGPFKNIQIFSGDPPAVRKQKIEQAKSMIGQEVLANIGAMDSRLTFVKTALSGDPFDQQFIAARKQIAPSVAGFADAGYRRLIAEQRVASLRQAFSSTPLRLEIGEALVRIYAEGGTNAADVSNFYIQLTKVEDCSQKLISVLSISPNENDDRTEGDDLLNSPEIDL
jgi:hypothetical protein